MNSSKIYKHIVCWEYNRQSEESLSSLSTNKSRRPWRIKKLTLTSATAVPINNDCVLTFSQRQKRYKNIAFIAITCLHFPIYINTDINLYYFNKYIKNNKSGPNSFQSTSLSLTKIITIMRSSCINNIFIAEFNVRIVSKVLLNILEIKKYPKQNFYI